MTYDRDDPETRPTQAQQLAGLSLFEPLPVNTRREAEEAIAERAPRLRAAVLAALRQGPKTADEVAAAIGETVLATRPRLTELHQAGLIFDSGTRRANASGKRAIVWQVKA